MKFKVLVVFFFASFYCWSQSDIDNAFVESAIDADFNKAKLVLNSKDNVELKKVLNTYLGILEKGDFDIKITSIPEANKPTINAVALLNISLVQYKRDGEILKSYTGLREALNISLQMQYQNLSFLICQHILEIYTNTVLESNDLSYRYLLDTMQKNAAAEWQYDLIKYIDFNITMRFFFKDSIAIINKKYLENLKLKSEYSKSFFEAKVNVAKSNYHNRMTNNLDSTYYYLNLAKLYYDKQLTRVEEDKFYRLSISEAAYYTQKGKHEKALKILDKMTNNRNDYIYKTTLAYIDYYKYLNHQALNNQNKALTHQVNYLESLMLQNESQKLQVVSELETKYQTAEKEKKILEQENQLIIEKQRKKQNRNIAIGVGSGLTLISVIGFLYFNNKKKKQEIELQNQVIAQEKLKTRLKDEELRSVDAMIEGQERERLNIANELHDDLGSLMSTIKLHFSSIKTDTTDEIYNKTNTLIENAYQKIRNISHFKNSGVLANKGLLKALKDLASTVSVSNQIQIEVYDNGLEQRIANSMELTLFRIIQELITNTLKHAKANLVEIHLTMDEEHLNIMVEDNGVGFNTDKTLKDRTGMGLLNIEKRIENLGGQMIVESQPGKGTSVILDIPL